MVDNINKKQYTGLKQTFRQLLTLGEIEEEILQKLLIKVEIVHSKISDTMKKVL